MGPLQKREGTLPSLMGPHQTVSQTPNQLELKSKAIEIKSKEKTLDRLSQTVKGFSLLLLPTC